MDVNNKSKTKSVDYNSWIEMLYTWKMIDWNGSKKPI